jgi:hypothetical protein
VALIDTFDRFDPEPAAAAGVELSRLLWVRGQALSRTSGVLDPAWIPGERSVQGPGTLLERTLDRAIKAFNLVAQSGVCTMVVLISSMPRQALARVPRSTVAAAAGGGRHRERAAAPGGHPVAARGAFDRDGNESRREDCREWSAGTSVPADGPWIPLAQERGRPWHSRPLEGCHDRTRRLGGLSTRVRAVSPRGYVGELPLAIG